MKSCCWVIQQALNNSLDYEEEAVWVSHDTKKVELVDEILSFL